MIIRLWVLEYSTLVYKKLWILLCACWLGARRKGANQSAQNIITSTLHVLALSPEDVDRFASGRPVSELCMRCNDISTEQYTEYSTLQYSVFQSLFPFGIRIGSDQNRNREPMTCPVGSVRSMDWSPSLYTVGLSGVGAPRVARERYRLLVHFSGERQRAVAAVRVYWGARAQCGTRLVRRASDPRLLLQRVCSCPPASQLIRLHFFQRLIVLLCIVYP